MAQQTINLGAAPDDGTGDTLRVGGDKINDNFDELYDEALKFKGSTDCSANPNYPAALKGDAYRVSVAGKIGGASGIDVEISDIYLATADNAGGTQAGVGSSWTVIQGNITSYLPLSGGTLTGDLIVPDEVYDATNWDGNLEVPTKNAVRDKIESLAGGGFTAASTTEILTGTDSTKGGTPDSIAALWEQGSDVASAGTISLGEGGYFNITGTTTITDIDFATDKAGRKAWVKFAGILTLTHNASTLILPTGANITTAAGDTACFVSEGADAVRCVSYNRASGAALSSSGGAAWTLVDTSGAPTASPTWTWSTNVANVDVIGLSAYNELLIFVLGVSVASGTGVRGIRVSVDNGSSFYAGASDYQLVNAIGTLTATTLFMNHGTGTTAARNIVGRIHNLKGAIKQCSFTAGETRYFNASASDINAIQLIDSGGVNMTAGSLYVYAR